MADLYEPLADGNNLAGPPQPAQQAQQPRGGLGGIGNAPPLPRSPYGGRGNATGGGKNQRWQQKDDRQKNRSMKERKKNLPLPAAQFPQQDRRQNQRAQSPARGKGNRGADGGFLDAKPNKPLAGTPKKDRKSDKKRRRDRDAGNVNPPWDNGILKGGKNKEKAPPGAFARPPQPGALGSPPVAPVDAFPGAAPLVPGSPPPFGTPQAAPGGPVVGAPPPIQQGAFGGPGGLGTTPNMQQLPPQDLGGPRVQKSEMISLIESSSGMDSELNGNYGNERGGGDRRKYDRRYDMEQEINALESNLELYHKQQHQRANQKRMRLCGWVTGALIVVFGVIFTTVGLIGVLLDFRV